MERVDKMTKQERVKLASEGKTILRPQWDQRRNYWKIVKYTQFGGWKRFGGRWYSTSTRALEIIDKMIEREPNVYVKED